VQLYYHHKESEHVLLSTFIYN